MTNSIQIFLFLTVIVVNINRDFILLQIDKMWEYLPFNYPRCVCVCVWFVWRVFCRVSADSLVVSAVQIKQTPPSLRCAVQHRKNTHKRGELTGSRWTPLLHHQLRAVSRRSRRLGSVRCRPVTGGKECAAAFESGAVESHGDDHQQTRRHAERVSGAVGQQQPPVQLHGGYQARKAVTVEIFAF